MKNKPAITSKKIARLKKQLADLEKSLDKMTESYWKEHAKNRRLADKAFAELGDEVAKQIESASGFKVGDTFCFGAIYDSDANKIIVTKAVITGFDVDVIAYTSDNGGAKILASSTLSSGRSVCQYVDKIFKTPEEAAAQLIGDLTSLAGAAAAKPKSAITVETFKD